MDGEAHSENEKKVGRAGRDATAQSEGMSS